LEENVKSVAGYPVLPYCDIDRESNQKKCDAKVLLLVSYMERNACP
jgi:hypothetical protein